MKNKTKIGLVENGVFPILTNSKGPLDTELSIPGTLQGEGKLIGIPSIFIRTSGCNLKCAWMGANKKGSLCDTPYSSFNPEKNMVEIDHIIQLVEVNACNLDKKVINHIVITGGEPTIQMEPLIELCKKLKEKDYHITLETNATIYNQELSEYVDLISMSPKLVSSTPYASHLEETGVKYDSNRALRHSLTRLNIEVIQNYIDSCYEKYGDSDVGENGIYKTFWKDFQLKFVVSNEEDMNEIHYILSKLKNWESQDIVLMPEGIDDESLKSRSKIALYHCIKNGWRFTPRLHINIWGNKKSI